MDLSKLKEPFPADEIEWRLQSCGESDGRVWGVCLAYVTNRAIQNRLDDVCGPENWKNEFQKGPDGGILCGISIKVGGEWITKYDGAENTDIEAVKGGLSGAMKRAAATGWGIGRYLYRLEENWAVVSDKGRFRGKTKNGKTFRWNPPELPEWALPPKGQAPAKLSPAAQAEFNEEFESLVLSSEQWLASDLLTPVEKRKAEKYITEKNMPGLKKFIDYCKERNAQKEAVKSKSS